MALPLDNANAALSKDLSYSDGAAIVVNTPFPVCDGFLCVGAGTATVVMQSGASLNITMTAGQIYQMKITNVTAAAATGLVALYK